MGDGVLAGDGVAVCEAHGYVVSEVGVYCGENGSVAGNGTYAREEIDGRFEGAGEQASARNVNLRRFQ